MKRHLKYFLLALSLIVPPLSANAGSAGDQTEQYISQSEVLVNSPDCTTAPPQKTDPALYKWPLSNGSAYHGNPDVYAQKDMFFCHGHVPETEKVIRVWPSWEYARREEFFYPITFVDTAAGILTVRGSNTPHPLLLNGEILMDEVDYAVISQAHVEPEGKPEIVIVNMIDFPAVPTDRSGGGQIVDLGVSPPFISQEPLPIGSFSTFIDSHNDTMSPPESYITIRKIDEGIYSFSGLSSYERNQDGDPFPMTFIYNRAAKTLKRME